jgi:hypothetical protein
LFGISGEFGETHENCVRSDVNAESSNMTRPCVTIPDNG